MSFTATKETGNLWKKVVASATAAVLASSLAVAPAATAFAAEDLSTGTLTTQANGPANDQAKGNYGSIYLSHWDAVDDSGTTGESTTLFDYDGKPTPISVNGISYDLASNTVTLNGCSDPTGCLHLYQMGEDLKINVIGTNSIGEIYVSGSDQGGSLDISGTGTLNINPNKYALGTPLDINGGGQTIRTEISRAEFEANSKSNYSQNVYYSPNYSSPITGYDEDGDPIYTTYYRSTYSRYPAKLHVGKSVNLNVSTDGSTSAISLYGTTLQESQAVKFDGTVKGSTDQFVKKSYNSQRVNSATDYTSLYQSIWGRSPSNGAEYEDNTTGKTWTYDASTSQWYRITNNKNDVLYYNYELAATSFTQYAKEAKVGNFTYKVTSADDATVSLTKAANKKSVTVPASVKINGKKFAVTGISAKAFKSAKKCKTVTIKSTKLTKKSVKNSLKGSKVKTVKVPKKQKSAYKDYFTKKNAGKSVTVK